MSEHIDGHLIKQESKFNSRKYRIAVGLLLGAALCIGLGVKPDPIWIDLIKWVFGIYVTGNVVQGAVQIGLERFNGSK